MKLTDERLNAIANNAAQLTFECYQAWQREFLAEGGQYPSEEVVRAIVLRFLEPLTNPIAELAPRDHLTGAMAMALGMLGRLMELAKLNVKVMERLEELNHQGQQN